MAAFWALISAVVLPYQYTGGGGGSFLDAVAVLVVEAAGVEAEAAKTGGTG